MQKSVRAYIFPDTKETFAMREKVYEKRNVMYLWIVGKGDAYESIKNSNP